MLQRTPDILGELGRRRAATAAGPLLVGFAAETADVVLRAAAKRDAKHVDLIVANDVSRADAGFDVDTNAVTIVGPGGRRSGARAAAEQDARGRGDPGRVEKLLQHASG